MNKKLILVFLTALTLRLSLVFSAYHGDLNNNISWGTIADEKGLKNFYNLNGINTPNLIGTGACPSAALCEGGWPYSVPNQPPLTIMLFAGVRFLWQVIENTSWRLNESIAIFPSPFIWFWENRGMILLIKLPAIFADVAMGWMIYQYIVHKIKDEKKALLIASVWLFNPVTWYNSSVWGQTDSVVNLLGLISVLTLLNGNLVLSSVFVTLSVLFKGSLTIFIPILGIVAIWQKHSLRVWIRSIAYCLFTIALVSIWFHPRIDLFAWLINLYRTRILPGEIGYLTANSFNFWWLVDPGKVQDSILFLGLPARIWGFMTASLGILGILAWLSKRHPELNQRTQNDKYIFLALCIISLITFLFMTRMHERYLYPFFPYATILLSFLPQLTFPYVVFSITNLFNLYHLFWVPPLNILENILSEGWFLNLISLLNLCAFILTLRLLRKAKI